MVLITQNRVCCERKKERGGGGEREREAEREIGRESGASYLPTGYFKHIQILGKSLEAP